MIAKKVFTWITSLMSGFVLAAYGSILLVTWLVTPTPGLPGRSWIFEAYPGLAGYIVVITGVLVGIGLVSGVIMRSNFLKRWSFALNTLFHIGLAAANAYVFDFQGAALFTLIFIGILSGILSSYYWVEQE